MARPRAVGLAALLAALAAAERARGDDIVVSWPQEDPLLTEVALRARAELAALGHQVSSVPSVDADVLCRPRSSRSSRSLRSSADAELSLCRAGREIVVSVRLPRSRPAASASRALPASDGRGREDANLLAVQAVDHLALVAAEADAALAEPADPALPAVRGHPFSGSLGLAILHNPAGLGSAAGPALRLSVPVRGALGASFALAGPIVGPELPAERGGARARQGLLGLGLVHDFYTSARVTASITGGGGLYLGRFRGQARPPDAGVSASHLSPFASGAVALAIRGAGPFYLAIEAGGAWLARPPRLLVGEEVLGSAGRPTWIASVGVGWSWPRKPER